MPRCPMFFDSSVSSRPSCDSSREYFSLCYSSHRVRADVYAELRAALRSGYRLSRRLVRVLVGTGGSVLKHRGRVAGYVWDLRGYPVEGFRVLYSSYLERHVAVPDSELFANDAHPVQFEPGTFAVVADSFRLSDIGALVPLADYHAWVIDGSEYRSMERRRDPSMFGMYWYEESDLEPVRWQTDGGAVFYLPQVVRVELDRDDFDWAYDDDDDEPEYGRGGWDCGIGNHDLKRRYDGPVIGVELEVDSEDRRELGELCASVGIHTCRDGSLDDSTGIELVSAPLDWRELRGESSPWGRVFADGDFAVHDPQDYGIHVSLNRRAISRGAQARIFYALNRWRSLESVFGRGATGYASKVSGGSKDMRKLAYGAVCSGTGKYNAANFSSRERLEVRCIAATSDWRTFRARVGLIDALRLFAEFAGWGMFTGDNFRAFMRERLIDSHPEAVAAYCGASRRSGRPLVSEVC